MVLSYFRSVDWSVGASVRYETGDMEDGTDDTELLLPKQHSKCHAFCGFWKIITYLGIIIGNVMYDGTTIVWGTFQICSKVW